MALKRYLKGGLIGHLCPQPMCQLLAAKPHKTLIGQGQS